MTVRDRASALRARASQIREAQKYEKHADTLEDKRLALENARRNLRSAVAVAGVLVKNKCLQSDALPDSEKLEDALTKIAEAFASDPSSIAKGRNFTTLSGHLDATTKSMVGITNAAWQKETNKAPKPNETLLDQIAQLPDQREAIDQIRTANANLAAASTNPPADQSGWDSYRTLLQLVEEQLESLSPKHFPPSARAFCIAAQSSRGARLSLLTDEVREWLEERDMLDKLRYRLT